LALLRTFDCFGSAGAHGERRPEDMRVQERFWRLPLAGVLTLLFVSCSSNSANLTQIQQQQSGDYLVALLNQTGTIKQHSNKLILEVRNANSNSLSDISNLQIQSSMRMPGMGPMFGNISAVRRIAAGQYEFDADFSMAGQWNCLVTFDPNGRVQFNINAQ